MNLGTDSDKAGTSRGNSMAREHALSFALVLGACALSACLEFDDASGQAGYCFDDDLGRYRLCSDAPANDAALSDVMDAADSGPSDAAPELDAMPELDAGLPDADEPDAGPSDTGAEDADAGVDAAMADAMQPDAGFVEVTLQPAGPGRLEAPGFGQSCAASCSFQVPAGTTLRVIAAPDTGAALDTWTQPAACLAAGAECVLLATEALVVGADFVLQQHTLSVQTAPASTGTGQVTGPQGIACPSACSASFAHGTMVTLVAEPGPGTRFARWLGDCVGGSLSCDVTMDAARTVLVEFEEVPPLVTNGQSADLVLGQPDLMTGSIQPLSGSSLTFPEACAADSTSLWIADAGNHRVLGWFALPTLDGQSADVALGQPNLISSGSQATSLSSVEDPLTIALAGGRLLVGDLHRLLIWDSLPTTFGASANRQLAQPDSSSNDPPSSPTADRFGFVGGVAVAGSTLLVADEAAHRVLAWSPVNSVSGLAAAGLVLGQPDMTTGTRLRPPTSASFATPRSIAYDPVSGRLAVADMLNHRVLIWYGLPSQNGQPADLILGQTSPSGRSRNAGLSATNAVGLDTPRGVHFTRDSLVVADFGNARVAVWTPVPTVTGAPATAVLGAPSLMAAGVGAAGPATLVGPVGLCQSGTNLFVADAGANRVVRFGLARP